VSLSGELRSASASIPRGTILGYYSAMALYFPLMLLLAAGVRREALIEQTDTLFTQISWSKGLVLAGVLSATVSTGISSMASAPRMLSALAADGIMGRLLSWQVSFESAQY